MDEFKEYKEPDLTYVYGAAIAVIALVALLAFSVGRGRDVGPEDVVETQVEQPWKPGQERPDNTGRIIQDQLGGPWGTKK